MVDPVSLSIAIVSLGVAGLTGYGLWIQRGQLRAAEATLAATQDQLAAEEKKVDALGRLVLALRRMVDAQTKEIEALGKIVDSLNRGIVVHEEEVAIARMANQIQAAQLAWDQTNPIDRAGMFIREVVDIEKEGIRRGLRRLLGGG